MLLSSVFSFHLRHYYYSQNFHCRCFLIFSVLSFITHTPPHFKCTLSAPLHHPHYTIIIIIIIVQFYIDFLSSARAAAAAISHLALVQDVIRNLSLAIIFINALTQANIVRFSLIYYIDLDMYIHIHIELVSWFAKKKKRRLPLASRSVSSFTKTENVFTLTFSSPRSSYILNAATDTTLTH